MRSKIQGSRSKKKNGFTLVELLVVISIISILTVIIAANFVESQKKGRDAARKANLKSLSDAVNLYYADQGSFPSSVSFGGELSFGTAASDKVIYMKKIPSETSPNVKQLRYDVSGTNRSFRLYTNLENDGDKDCLASSICNSLGYSITSGCCYIITSSNIGATEALK